MRTLARVFAPFILGLALWFLLYNEVAHGAHRIVESDTSHERGGGGVVPERADQFSWETVCTDLFGVRAVVNGD
jgi:hypothetical protein